MAWKSTTWWHAGRAIAAAVAVALGCLAPLSSPAGAEGPDALFWELTQSAAQTYRMRLGAELPARRLPADWQASLGTEIGFAAAPRGGRPGRSLPPAGRQPDPTCRFWGGVTLPGIGPWLPGWRDIRLDMGYDPAGRQGELSLTAGRHWPLGSGLSVGMTDKVRLFLRGEDHMAPRWRGATSVKLDFSPTGTHVRLDAGRAERGRGVRRALVAEQRLFGTLTLSAAMAHQADGTTGRRIGASYRPWDGVQLSAGQRSMPGRRPERSLRFRLVHDW